MTQNRNLKSNKAFTLIELLVTVAVIGIISGVALSGYSEYRQRTNHLTAKVAARDLITAYHAFLVNLSPSDTNSYSFSKEPGEEPIITGGITAEQMLPGISFMDTVMYRAYFDARYINIPDGLMNLQAQISTYHCGGTRFNMMGNDATTIWTYQELTTGIVPLSDDTSGQMNPPPCP